MLPWAMRRRSASGVMSTSSICSARRTTASGTVSCWVMPVIFSTTSFTDSRCWILTVVMTSMPASSIASTSCQRFSWVAPGAFVCASSSTRTTSGFRARTASTSISSSVAPRYSYVTRGTISRSRTWRVGLWSLVGLDVADHDVGAALASTPPFVEHSVGLADAWGGAQIDPQLTARTQYRSPCADGEITRRSHVAGDRTRPPRSQGHGDDPRSREIGAPGVGRDDEAAEDCPRHWATISASGPGMPISLTGQCMPT